MSLVQETLKFQISTKPLIFFAKNVSSFCSAKATINVSVKNNSAIDFVSTEILNEYLTNNFDML